MLTRVRHGLTKHYPALPGPIGVGPIPYPYPFKPMICVPGPSPGPWNYLMIWITSYMQEWTLISNLIHGILTNLKCHWKHFTNIGIIKQISLIVTGEKNSILRTMTAKHKSWNIRKKHFHQNKYSHNHPQKTDVWFIFEQKFIWFLGNLMCRFQQW